MTGAWREPLPVVTVDPGLVDDGDPERFLAAFAPGPEGSVRVIHPDHLDQVADHDEMVPALVVCGGDRLVRRCLALVAGTTTALGILALGPGRRLAEQLGAPSPTDQHQRAFQEALHGPLRRLDLVELDDTVFATVGGFGTAEMIPLPRDRRRGIGGFIRSLRRLPRRGSFLTVHVDGVQRWAGRTPVVLIGTGSHLIRGDESVEVFPGADPADGELEVAVLAPRHPLDAVLVLIRLLTGRAQSPRLLCRFRGGWVHVRAHHARPIEVDGEARRPTSVLDAHIRPGALLVREPSTVRELGSERELAQLSDATLQADPEPDPEPESGEPRWVPARDGACPPEHPIKANERSGIFHPPEGRSYARTRADRCYCDAATAIDDGFRPARH